MSTYPDHACFGLRSTDQAGEFAGLRGEAPWRSIPLWVSNDRAEAYFEIYSASSSHSLDSTQWRWRLRTPDGQVRACSDVYASSDDCLNAVHALRQSAGAARVRHIE